ncbi:hypothetical protein ACFL7M_15550 [Thermodesulfobacteriota bacterium]
MQLSNSGRVVLIDDKAEEIEPLLVLLGKQNVPYLYFDGALDNLPETPPEGVRFVFLDIELGSKAVGIKNQASALTGVLSKVVSASNGPYVIIFWTRHKEVIEQILENCNKKSISPVAWIDLDKPKLVSKKDNKYDLAEIMGKLDKKLSKIGAFYLYVQWENILNSAGKQFVHDFSGVVDTGTDWTKKTSELFYALYKSYVEKNVLHEQTEQFKCACHVMNQSFFDLLQNYTATKLELPEGFTLSHGKVERNTLSKLNTSLLINEGLLDRPSTGYVYKEINRSLLASLSKSLFKKDKQPADMILCKIILTPECDLARNKTLITKKEEDGQPVEYKIHRSVYGVLFPCVDDQKDNRSGKGSPAQFDIGPIWYQNKIYQIIIHFLTISTQNEKKIKGKPLFALKRNLIFDLQSKAANHVNRLGSFQLS